jgi:hypothetical protein
LQFPFHRSKLKHAPKGAGADAALDVEFLIKATGAEEIGKIQRGDPAVE